jgi:hypothetical protein
MKKSRYSERQIIKILKEDESGMPVTDICREHGICGVHPAGAVEAGKNY